LCQLSDWLGRLYPKWPALVECYLKPTFIIPLSALLHFGASFPCDDWLHPGLCLDTSWTAATKLKFCLFLLISFPLIFLYTTDNGWQGLRCCKSFFEGRRDFRERNPIVCSFHCKKTWKHTLVWCSDDWLVDALSLVTYVGSSSSLCIVIVCVSAQGLFHVHKCLTCMSLFSIR